MQCNPGQRRRLFGLLCLLIGLPLYSCAPIHSADLAGRPVSYPYGQITLFLNGPKTVLRDLTWDIGSISLTDQKGESIELLEQPGLKLSAEKIRARQIKLAERAAGPGRYTGLRIKTRQATVAQDGAEGPAGAASELDLPEEEIFVPVSVTAGSGRAVALFLGWEPDSSIIDGRLFRPALYARAEAPAPAGLMIYVANEGSDNVYAINRHSGEVEAVVLTGRGPRGLAVNTIAEAPKVFVANAGGNSLTVIDVRSNTVETEIPLIFGQEPVAVAAARLSGRRENIYVANYRSGTVSMIDGSAYQEAERIEVGSGPVDLVADSPEDAELDASLSAADAELLRNYRRRYRNLYVSNSNDLSISVLAVNTTTGLTESVLSLPLQWAPKSLFIDHARAALYSVHPDCDCISVISIVRLIRGDLPGAVTYIREAGISGIDIAVDRTMNRIYLLRESPPEVLVLRPPQTGPLSIGGLPALLGSMEAGQSPAALALDPEGRRLYLIDRASLSLIVTDRITGQPQRLIPLGRRPYGISIFAD